MHRYLTSLLDYFIAHRQLRRLPPPDSPEHRRQRLLWCRDHCGDFAGRWFGVGCGLWLLQATPFAPALLPWAYWPAFLIAALLAMVVGTAHIVWQIVAQSRVGLPPIEPPVDFKPPRQKPPRQRDGRYM